MRRHLLWFLVLVLLLVNITALLFGAVHATYTPEPKIDLVAPIAPFTHPDLIGTKIGRFELWSDDGDIYTPVLIVSSDVTNPVVLEGLYYRSEWNDYLFHDNLTFNVVFLTYQQGSNPQTGHLSQASNNQVALLGEQATIHDSNLRHLIVDVYLLNTSVAEESTPANPPTANTAAQHYLRGASYSFKNSFAPTFTLVSADQGGTYRADYVRGSGLTSYGASSSYIEVNGSGTTKEAPSPMPLLLLSSDGLLLGDEGVAEPIIKAFFTLKKTAVPIDFAEYIGSQVRKINTAYLEIDVLHGDGNEVQNVDVMFTDDAPSGLRGFHFLHQSPAPSVPYSLYWGDMGTPIIKGVPIAWDQLTKGTHSKDIFMGHITESTLSTAAIGTYRSIITITLTNRD